jgi:nucleoside phosphorylase
MHPWPGLDVIIEGAISETTYRFGRFGRYRAAHVESTMGTQGRHGVTLKARAALAELGPKAMLILGIAFGVDRKKQRLGDVIVAETVQPYAYERVGTLKVIPRGTEISCGIDLSERFRTRRRGWEAHCGRRKVEVFQGQMLSGPKLIDDEKFRDALVLRYPNAKGGEMEGEGGYSAAEQARIQTILIKSICDWADGHKNDRAQSFAASTAVSLAEHVLSQPDVLDVIGALDILALADGVQTTPSDSLTDKGDRGYASKAGSENSPDSSHANQQVTLSDSSHLHGDVTQIGNVTGDVHIGKKRE